MKKTILILSLNLFLNYANSQSTVANGVIGNQYLAGRFLGWNATSGNLDFRTNNLNRMTLTDNTGLFAIGLNFNTPAALLHLNSNGNLIGGELFRTTGAVGQINAWRMFTGGAGALERFSLFVPASTSHGIFQVSQATGVMGFNTSGNVFGTLTPSTRMLIRMGDTSATSGWIAMGNNLGLGFIPQDRLHLHHNSLTRIRTRYTHLGTGTTVNDGFALGLESNNDYRFSQYENNPTDFYTRRGIDSTQMLLRFRIDANGQTYVGNAIETENVMYGAANVFSQVPTSLFNVSGPINSCARMDASNPLRTVLYAYTTPYGSPAGDSTSFDGWRLKQNLFFRGAFIEAMVFEKTESAQADPDGYIAFTNTGNDSLEEISAFIDGKGRSYFGHNLPILGNRVTIDSDTLLDATESGLRFIKLTSSDATVANPGTGVLSVDEDGDVIYVAGGGAVGPQGPAGADGAVGPPGPTGPSGVANANNGLSISGTNNVVLGQDATGSGPANLLNDRFIPMNNKQLNFENGFVNVNSLPGEYNHAGLSVRPGNALYFTNPYSGISAVRGLQVTNDVGYSIGIESNAISAVGACYGVVGTANSTSEGGTVVGIDGISNGNLTNNTSVYGLRGHAYNGGTHSYGVSAKAQGAVGNNYAFYGETVTNNANDFAAFFKGGTTQVQGNLVVVGNMAFNGTLSGINNIVTTSDQQFKTGINPIANASSLIQQLQPRTYYMDTMNQVGMRFSSKKQYGFIAQEVEQILPELVETSTKPAEFDSLGNVLFPETNYKSLNYNAFFGIFAQASKEQQAQLNEKDSIIAALTNQLAAQDARLSAIESCLSNWLPTLCEMNQSAIQQNTPEAQQQIKSALEVTLSNKNSIILSQNLPNPFAESTVIEYNIPATVKHAQIQFYDNQGKIIQTLDLTERGKGSINVFANDLSSGMYTYTLVADGKVEASKKMVKK